MVSEPKRIIFYFSILGTGSNYIGCDTIAQKDDSSIAVTLLMKQVIDDLRFSLEMISILRVLS